MDYHPSRTGAIVDRRRTLFMIASASIAAGCAAPGPRTAAPLTEPPLTEQQIAAIIAAPDRTDADRANDTLRRPDHGRRAPGSTHVCRDEVADREGAVSATAAAGDPAPPTTAAAVLGSLTEPGRRPGGPATSRLHSAVPANKVLHIDVTM